MVVSEGLSRVTEFRDEYISLSNPVAFKVKDSSSERWFLGATAATLVMFRT